MNITLRKWIEEYSNGKYFPKENDDEHEKMCEAGWYDWFCGTSELASRLEKCYQVASKITNDYILDNFYVWFKNNCPLDGDLYDDMRFEPLDEKLRDKKYFLIAFFCCHYNKNYAVITARNSYEVEFETNDEEALINYINSLDFEKDIHLSINDWLKKVGTIEELSPKKLTDVLDIVEKNLWKRLIYGTDSSNYDIFVKLTQKCACIYNMMMLLNNEKLKSEYFVELSQFNVTGNSFFFDECSIKKCDDEKVEYFIAFDFPFKEWKKTKKTDLDGLFESNDFLDTLPDEEFKYTLFSANCEGRTFEYATNNLEEFLEKLNKL